MRLYRISFTLKQDIKLRIVHLPFYDDNPYQEMLMDAQMKLGNTAISGGGGGNFLRTMLFKWKPDVVHFHWLHPYLLRKSKSGSILRSIRFLLEVCLLRARGIRVAWTIHNLENHDKQHLGIEKLFTRLFARLCDVRIAHSPEAANQAVTHFSLQAGSVRVIPHPSYIGLYPMDIEKGEARTSLKLDQADKVLLFLGRINEYKGVFDLIACLPDYSKNLRLVIAGVPGDEQIQTRLQQAQKHDSRVTIFPERIPDEKLQIFFNAADIVVFPYRDILTSGAVILAMSFGKFVIVPDMPVMRETVPEKGGIFFKRLDMGSLKEAIMNSLELDTDGGGRLNKETARAWTLDTVAQKTIWAYGFDD